LCIDQFNNGSVRTALEFARRFADLVAGSTDSVELMMADRILGTAWHYFGDQKKAGYHINRALMHDTASARQSRVVSAGSICAYRRIISRPAFYGSSVLPSRHCRWLRIISRKVVHSAKPCHDQAGRQSGAFLGVADRNEPGAVMEREPAPRRGPGDVEGGARAFQ
jgi:hypothetical protein